MKVIRRIFRNIDSNEKKMLIEHAFGCKMDRGYFNHDLDEKSEEYNRTKKLVHLLDLQDAIIGSEFTKEEIEQAEVLVFRGAWTSGYPQPLDPISVFDNTYIDSCPECGVHGEQKAAFQIKGPKLGKHKLMQLNWVFDELFSESKFYQDFFQDMGLPKQEVLLYKKNLPIETIVQLLIPVATSHLDMGNRESSTCLVCNRLKYSPVDSGFFPAPSSRDFQIVKTLEFFGDGHSAFRRILVSNAFMKRLLKHKAAKHHQFVPCK